MRVNSLITWLLTLPLNLIS